MKQICTSAIIIAGFLFSPAVWGQKDFQHHKDSLLSIVASVEGQAKISAYYDLTSFLYFNEQNMDSVLKYLYLNEKEAKMQHNLEAERNVRKNIGGLFRNRGLYDKFLERAYDDLDFMEKHEFWETYYDLTRKIVESYHFAGQDKKALSTAMEFYEQARQKKHSEGIQCTLYAIGFYYEANKREAEAEKYFRMCLDEANRSGKVTDIKLTCYYQLISTLVNHHKWDECKELFPQWEADTEKRAKDETRTSSSLYLNLYLMYLHYYGGMDDDVQAEKYCRLLEEKWPENGIVQLVTTTNWASVYQIRKNWAKMLEYSEKAYKLHEKYNTLISMASLSQYKAKALNYLGRADECYAEIEHYTLLRDSLANQELNAQLDELRTQYEVDKITVEKEQNRRNFLFALAGIALLLILVTVILINRRKIHRKNKTLASQIKELQELQQIKENELLQKSTFQTPETDAADLCPESRKDKLCLKLRDLLLKDKIYRDASLSRDRLTEQLGINRYDLEDAFKFCFNTPYSEYINELRLKDAVFMLEQSDLPIVDISEKAGFGTLRTFQRQFATQYNMSPKDYRVLAGKE